MEENNRILRRRVFTELLKNGFTVNIPLIQNLVVL